MPVGRHKPYRFDRIKNGERLSQNPNSAQKIVYFICFFGILLIFAVSKNETVDHGAFV